MKIPKKYFVLAVIAILVVLLGAGVWGKFDSAQRTMVKKETSLGSLHGDCMNTLSNHTAKIKEALGVADRSTAALDKVLENAVSARYEGRGPSQGEMFSAITEAYPDLNGVSINYENVQSAIFAGRDAFSACQTRLLDQYRDYMNWKNAGFIDKSVNALVGAPSENLLINIGGEEHEGKDALKKIRTLVITKEATKSYQTGVDEGIDTGAGVDLLSDEK